MENKTQIQTLHVIYKEREAYQRKADMADNAIENLCLLWNISEKDLDAIMSDFEKSLKRVPEHIIHSTPDVKIPASMPSSSIDTASFKMVGDYTSYPFNGQILERVLYIIKAEQRFLHVREMTFIASKVEKINDVGLFKKKFSPILSIEVKEANPQVVSLRVGDSRNNTFYGLPGWVSDFGIMRPEYVYDKDALQYNPDRDNIVIVNPNLKYYGGGEMVVNDSSDESQSPAEIETEHGTVVLPYIHETQKATEVAFQDS